MTAATTIYDADLTGQVLWVTEPGGNVRAAEVYPIYGRDDADRWLESHGYTFNNGWYRSGGLRRAVWSRQVSR